MGWNDKLSEAKEEASERVSGTKENASSKVAGATELLSGTLPTSESIGDIAHRAKERATLEYRYTKSGLRHPIRRVRVVASKYREDPARTFKGLLIEDEEVMEEIIEATKATERQRANFWTTVSYQDFASKGSRVKQPVQSYGATALDLSRDINPKQTYRYGKYGAKAGAKYGDYLPVVGDLAPQLGFVAGALVGAADSVDAIDGAELLENIEPASDAVEEVAYTESDQLRTKMFRGGVAYAESRFGRSSEPNLDELVDMDYDDFADH